MQKNLIYLVFSILLLSCTSQGKIENIHWYENQVIEQLETQDDSLYRVQIGIMASSFWLDKQDKNSIIYLPLLQNSLTQRNKLDIGIEKGSNRIKYVKKVK